MKPGGSRPKLRSCGCYGPGPAMKPGVYWQDCFHCIEMFQKYPNGPVGRSWKAACNSCQSIFEPIKPCVVFFEGGSSLQEDDKNQPDVVLVRNPRANARNRVRNCVRQQRVLYLPSLLLLATSKERRLFCISPSSIESGIRVSASRAAPSSVSPNACRCEAFAIKCQDAGEGDIRHRFFQGHRKFLLCGSNRTPVAFEWPGKETLEPIATLLSSSQTPDRFPPIEECIAPRSRAAI